ncbi:MAG: FAD-dependent oxidoreductase [Candidatus Cloacimonetes bacterium]|nr:FAD-dependent oxidoreductase [Candidatus Cloacimonadota bacterium]MCF7812978.1 FAD-dependent oxidoreductase [Candidatus Cloacimonadota bacterium]MCF7867290.1 FAD-dependent oxidoreductase [Candidatus Cloacimonadota bacterium]MCF7882734.1 FAD-dependent oxidoreductase [Candidatus Cloacimonadota bacterium]
MKYDYHVIVLGAGSAGLTVASGAAGLGAKVALIENHKMGGDCLNYGCVPSKTFLRTAHLAKDITNSDEFALAADLQKVDLKKVMQRVKSVIAEIEPHDSKERFEGLGVDVFLVEATLIDPHTVQLGDKQISGKKIVIATGSTARIPPIPGLGKVDFLTNKTIFDLSELPDHLVIIGGGPIGLELGQGFRHLGAKVTIIDHNDHLFPKDDPEVWQVMKEVFDRDGVELCLQCKVKAVSQQDKLKTVLVESAGKEIKISGDALLVSAGRLPNTTGLNLDKLGVKTDKRGYIISDNKMKTSIKNIFAAGDVTGPFQFTHMAGYQAGKVVPNAILGFGCKASYKMVPWTTYTKPEVAHIGYTQPWAEKLGIYRDALIFRLAEIDRAKADNDRDGFLKLILGKKGKIIGATLVGEKAGEMIPIASLAIARGMKASAFASVIFSYPTQAEIFQRLSFEYMKRSFKDWMKKLIEKLFL